MKLGRPVKDAAVVPDAVEVQAPSPSTERMRVHRLRRARGLRFVGIEVREAEIDALIRMGLLKSDLRDETSAVVEAIHEFLDVTLSR